MDIDWDRVRELHYEIGASDFDEVVSLFLSEVDEALARIAVASGPDDLRADLHFIKGCALNIGFHSLAEACRLADEPEDLPGRTEAITTAHRSCLAAFRAGRSALDGAA